MKANPYSREDIVANYRALMRSIDSSQEGFEILQWFRSHALTIIGTLLTEEEHTL